MKELIKNYKERLPTPKINCPNQVRRSVNCANKYIFDQRLDNKWLKKKCYISSKNFASLFKFYMGKTPKQYILYHRVEVAKILLIETDESISMIGYELGFHSPSAFSLAFKNEMGSSPNHFRNNKLGK